MTEPWWITLMKSFVVINIVLAIFAYTTLLERKLMGRMQLRYGPNRAGPFGLLQPIADLLKLIRKEAFSPANAIELPYIVAPVVSAFTALAAFSVIPWGPGWTISGSESERPSRTTPSTLSASETSYDTSCAHVRIDPSSEYFDSDAQPPTMKP